MRHVEELNKIYNLGSPIATGLSHYTKASSRAKGTKVCSPNKYNSTKNSTQVISTASMRSLFKDLSRKVSNHVSGGSEKSTVLTSQKNLKLLRKQAKIPPSGRGNSSNVGK